MTEAEVSKKTAEFRAELLKGIEMFLYADRKTLVEKYEMTLKEKCLNTLDPDGSNTWQRIEWIAGCSLRNRQHTVDALGDLCEAVKLVAVILVEENGARASAAQEGGK